MRSFAIAAVVGVLTTAAAPLAQAADTPQKTYDHYVDCTSHMMALQIAGERQKTKGSADKSEDMGRFVGVMRDKAIAAGKAVSVPPERVVAQIDQGRDRLVKLMDTSAPPNSKPFGQEIGLPALSCAFDELGKKIAERKAEQAAHAAK